MTDLANCPCCGKVAVLSIGNSSWFFIRCVDWCVRTNEHPSAAIAAEAWNRRASPWRPMSECPEDTPVLGLIDHKYIVTAMKVRQTNGALLWVDYHGPLTEQPIAWMPIPELETSNET